LFTPLLLAGMLTLKSVRRSRAVLLIGWPLTIYVFLAGITWQNWRFPLALFPPLLVLVGLGSDGLWRLLGRQQLPVWQRPLLLVYCLVALLGSTAWAVRDVGNFAAWANRSKQIALDVGRQVPPEATLIAFGLTATVQHYTPVDTREFFFLTQQDLWKMVGVSTGSAHGASDGSQGVYLLIDPDNVQTQWAGKSPAHNFAWLRQHTRLVFIARYDAYVLYQVVP
jgi:hypothetical protein